MRNNYVSAAGWTLLGMAGLLVTAFIWWMFFGSGYAEIAPTAYRFSTTILLSTSGAASDAKALIERDGFISIVEQRRLMQRIASDNK